MNRPPLPPRPDRDDPPTRDRAPRWLIAVLALALAASLAGLALAPHHKPAPSSTSSTIAEDDPRWNPRTMGDRCWGEPNPAMPDGIEILCADPEAYEAYVADLAAHEPHR